MKSSCYEKCVFLSVVLLCCISFSIVVAQPSPTIEWQRCIGGYSTDFASQVLATRDGGYIIAATTASNDGDVRNAPPNMNNGWIVKLDKAGQILWSRCIDGDHQSFLSSVLETLEGDFVVAGGTYSIFLGNIKTHGDCDAFVCKLTKEGDIIWQKAYGGSGSDIATSIVENKSEGGGYLFGGVTSSSDGDVLGRHPGIVGVDSTDAWVVKINLNGDIEWQKCIGGSKDESLNFIVNTKDGGYTFIGNTSSNDGDVLDHKIVRTDGWIVKLNSSGNILWQNYLHGAIYQGKNQPLVSTEDGGYTVIGITGDSSILGYHKPSSIFDNGEVYIVHLNSLGTILWERCYGGSTTDAGISIIATADFGYLFIGTVNSNDGDVEGLHKRIVDSLNISSDVWIVKLSNDGNIEWKKCFGGSTSETGRSIIQTKDGKILFLAEASSIDGDVEGIHSNGIYNRTDIWVVKLGINADVPVNSNFDFTGLIRDKFLKIYPNPSSSSVHLEMLSWFTAKGVEIYNLLGTKITCETTLAENGANVNVKSLPNGTYIARVAYTSEKVNGTFTLPLIVYH